MNVLKSAGNHGGTALFVVVLLALPGLPAFGVVAETPAETPATNPASTEVAPAAPAVPLARFSAGLQEIVRMVDAKVDPEVIKAYIKNSAVPYSPTAGEIIALKKKGVPDDIVTALLQHGADVRAQAAIASPPMSAAPAAVPYGAAPGAYPYDYADYGSPYYDPYPYGYSYPYNYWWYSYGYPWGGFYSPFFFVDGFGHRHFRDFDHHFDRFGPAHGGRGFQGTGSRSPFAPFNSRAPGFAGNRSLSPFSPFNPGGRTFAASSRAFRPAGGGGMGRPASMGGGFRSGGGAGGRGGGGHR